MAGRDHTVSLAPRKRVRGKQKLSTYLWVHDIGMMFSGQESVLKALCRKLLIVIVLFQAPLLPERSEARSRNRKPEC